MPAACPGCGQTGVGGHGGYRHGGEPGDAEPLIVQRFRCAGCGKAFGVLPDALLPGSSYPASTRDRAVATYVSGKATYRQIAAQLQVAATTVWRWVLEATQSAERRLETVRAQLRALGLADGPVRFREELRAIFRSRRVRRPGMLDGLLLVEALPGWVAELREALLARGWGPLCTGLFAFGRHVLDRLAAAAGAGGKSTGVRHAGGAGATRHEKGVEGRRRERAG